MMGANDKTLVLHTILQCFCLDEKPLTYGEFDIFLQKIGWAGDSTKLWAELISYCRGGDQNPLTATLLKAATSSPPDQTQPGNTNEEHVPPALPDSLADGMNTSLEQEVFANPTAYTLTAADVLALYTSPGYNERESETQQEVLVDMVLKGLYDTALKDGTVSKDLDFNGFVSGVLGLNIGANGHSMGNGTAAKTSGRLPPMFMDPDKTTPAEFCAALLSRALSSAAVNHPYLHRLAGGQVPNILLAICDFAEQYQTYSASFFKMTDTCMSKLVTNPDHKAALQNDLDEEAGRVDTEKAEALAAVGVPLEWYENNPHKELFARFVSAAQMPLGLDGRRPLLTLTALNKLKKRRGPGDEFADRMLALVSGESEAGAAAIMAFGVEGIVSNMYNPIVRALKERTRMHPRDYCFFPLHIEVDDDHAETLSRIAEDLAGDAVSRHAMVLALDRSLQARALLWDKLLARAESFSPLNSISAIAFDRDPQTTASLVYNVAADNWVRKEPTCLSDFTGREPIFKLCAPLLDAAARSGDGARILDLGCGEGYVARRLKTMGAKQVVGIDVSSGMIQKAKTMEVSNPLGGLQYFTGDATQAKSIVLEHLPTLGLASTGDVDRGLFDIVIAVFMFNYVVISDMNEVMRQAHELLKPGGTFVFSVPHPAFQFWDRKAEAPFFFSRKADKTYFNGRDAASEGTIFTTDGKVLPVRCLHKTFGDYLTSMAAAGFTAMPQLQELTVTPDLAAKGAFFQPVKDVPLHVAFTVQKDSTTSVSKTPASTALLWSATFGERDLKVIVPPAAMAELAAAVHKLRAAGLCHDTFQEGDAGPMPEVSALGAVIARRLFKQAGGALLQLDMQALGCGKDGCRDKETEAAAKLAYALLCSAVGTLRSEPRWGRLFDVKNRGLDVRNDNVLFSASAQECTFHTDSTNKDVFPDVVGLLCIRPASGSGGDSLLCNAVNAYYSLKNKLPAFLMYELERYTVRDFIGSGLGSEGDTLKALGRSPDVFIRRLRSNRFPIYSHWGSGRSEKLTFRYMRTWMESGHRRAGLTISPLLKVASDLLDAELDAQCKVNRQLGPGEILFCNNHITGHARTAFVDAGEDERTGQLGRLLVRCWLQCDPALLDDGNEDHSSL